MYEYRTLPNLNCIHKIHIFVLDQFEASTDRAKRLTRRKILILFYFFVSILDFSAISTVSPTSPEFEDNNNQLFRKTRLYSIQPRQRKPRSSLTFTRKGTI